MRFPCLALLGLPLLLCAAAFGQSGPVGDPSTVPGSDSPSPFEPRFNFDVSALPNRATTNQSFSPCLDASSACPKSFRLDRRVLGKLHIPPSLDSHKQGPTGCDPSMAIHPPQSAIGNLPSKPVLPQIYPGLKMLFIHGQSVVRPTGE